MRKTCDECGATKDELMVSMGGGFYWCDACTQEIDARPEALLDEIHSAVNDQYSLYDEGRSTAKDAWARIETKVKALLERSRALPRLQRAKAKRRKESEYCE